MSVGKNIAHDSARTHVSGKSVFVDDRARLKNEVLVGVLGAPVSAGNVLSIEYSEALKVPGVLGVYTGADFHHNFTLERIVFSVVIKEIFDLCF